MAEKVTVSIGCTHNLGNYNNVKIDAQRETEIRPDETPQDAFDRAWAEVEAEVEEKLEEYKTD